MLRKVIVKHRKKFLVGNLHSACLADPKFVKTAEIILINVEAGKVSREYWWIREMQIDKADGTLCIWMFCHILLFLGYVEQDSL